jgi:hypothetical protein
LRTVKTWVLTQSKLSEGDIIWLKGLNVKTVVEPLYNTVHTFRGQHQVVSGVHIELETACEKQETMLYLKFGNNLILKQVISDAS